MSHNPFSNTLRILHVEDDEDDFILIRDMLTSMPHIDAELEWASSTDEALEELLSNRYDLCLLDYRLGENTGLEILQRARADNNFTPIILLSGSGNRRVDVEAMSYGALYYLDKRNLDEFDLERAIRYGLEHTRLMREISELNETLEARVAERTQLLLQAKEQLEKEIEERKRVEHELRQARGERIRHTLEQMGRPAQMNTTSRLLGIRPLQESSPEVFENFKQQFTSLMDLALERRAYRIEDRVSDELRILAQHMGSLQLSPRDVVEIHTSALRAKNNDILPQKAEAYIEEGRLMLLELMGYLASYYRNFASSRN